MSVKIYDGDRVALTVGAIVGRGLGEDEFVRVEENVPRFSLKVGVDGQGSRSKDKNQSGKITITLMQTSEMNDELSALHEADKLAPNGAGIVPVRLSDLSGRALYVAAECWIAEPPKPAYGRTAGQREWVLECEKLIRFDGGN